MLKYQYIKELDAMPNMTIFIMHMLIITSSNLFCFKIRMDIALLFTSPKSNDELGIKTISLSVLTRVHDKTF